MANMLLRGPKLSPLNKKIFFKLMPLLMLCYFMSFLDRTNIALAKDRMEIDLGISAAVYGLGAGLFFLAYQRDPRTQFVPIQQRLSKNDALNEYIKHVASVLYAVPPGTQEGSFIGAGLFS